MPIIVKQDSFKDLLSLRERMDSIFEESLGRVEGQEELTPGRWVPPVDIYETTESIILQVELPGLSHEDIQLEVKNNTLILSGERRFQKDVKQENYHRIERSYGPFNRSFNLPSAVELDKIKAKFSNGILEVRASKQEKAKPRQIKVQVE